VDGTVTGGGGPSIRDALFGVLLFVPLLVSVVAGFVGMRIRIALRGFA